MYQYTMKCRLILMKLRITTPNLKIMRLFTSSLLSFILCSSLLAQEPIVYPYNPDADNDALVGVTDLLPLLSFFGDEFQPGEILVDGVALAEVLMTMQQTIEALQLQVETLEAQAMPELAAHLSFVDSSSTFHLEAANLQVSNGASAYVNNGLGNLIVGMNGEEEYVDSVGRGGSHNLVIGEGHAYSNSHGILHGFNATLTDRYAAVIGGSNNRVDGAYGVAIAGNGNTLSDGALYAVAAGGRDNVVYADYAAAISGLRSLVAGEYSAAISGNDNWIAPAAIYAASLAGKDNAVIGPRSATVAGADNIAIGERSLLLGGEANEATAIDAVVLGGVRNYNDGNRTVIVGGEENQIGTDSTDTRYSVIVGGRFGILNAGYCGLIAGGLGNSLVPDTFNEGFQTRSIFGGGGNTNAGKESSTMLGGSYNSLNVRPGASRDVSIGTNSFLGSIRTDNTQNIRVTGELEEE